MSELTKEWLQKTIAELEEERDATPGAVNEDAAMSLAAMKLALASLEAEPVAWMYSASFERGHVEGELTDAPGCDMPAYTAPPAPVSVPECFARFHEVIKNRHYGRMPEEVQSAFDECAAMLQGAEPVTTAYKLRDAVEIIRNSGIEIDAEKIFAERDALNTPDCWCRTCRPVTMTDMRFVVCPECGNKRCPHANDHQNACTGSNEPGQEGSGYPAAPQQEA
ncbi:hypothetical protein G9387_09580 [Enterobacter hormaechei]|uniref:hypothetical protein n=1 Tax=Enterobacter hormaechei TaxID=158836 RepID=UPI0013EF61DE|nr:hypothetical protein [Enterobacter hormaechei]KAF6704477.1 hypothetical protein G9393_11980 [Enterobacter hormaechei]KAF6712392.1 hypothetical protein G9387_09580 [Enterobacter hormaechei]